MARWYVTYNDTTNTTLETNLYQRVSVAAGTIGPLFTTMASTRAALSAQFYGQIDADNKDGSIGLVVPSDGYTYTPGTSFAWSNLYINAGAAYSTDRATRPTAPITVAGSTAESPVDSGTISETPTAYYANAVAAVEAAMSAAGVRTKRSGDLPSYPLGLDPWRTLASLHDDTSLTYLAWDDYSPGVVTAPTSIAGLGTGASVELTASWGGYTYPNDGNPSGQVVVEFSIVDKPGTGTPTFNQSATVTEAISGLAGNEQTWTVPATVVTGTYEIQAVVYLKDATIPDHYTAGNRGDRYVLMTNDFVHP